LSISQSALFPDIAGEPVPPAKAHHPQNPLLPPPGVMNVPEKAVCQFGCPYAWAAGANIGAARATNSTGRIAMSFGLRSFSNIFSKPNAFNSE